MASDRSAFKGEPSTPSGAVIHRFFELAHGVASARSSRQSASRSMGRALDLKARTELRNGKVAPPRTAIPGLETRAQLAAARRGMMVSQDVLRDWLLIYGNHYLKEEIRHAAGRSRTRFQREEEISVLLERLRNRLDKVTKKPKLDFRGAGAARKFRSWLRRSRALLSRRSGEQRRDAQTRGTGDVLDPKASADIQVATSEVVSRILKAAQDLFGVDARGIQLVRKLLVEGQRGGSARQRQQCSRQLLALGEMYVWREAIHALAVHNRSDSGKRTQESATPLREHLTDAELRVLLRRLAAAIADTGRMGARGRRKTRARGTDWLTDLICGSDVPAFRRVLTAFRTGFAALDKVHACALRMRFWEWRDYDDKSMRKALKVKDATEAHRVTIAAMKDLRKRLPKWLRAHLPSLPGASP